MTNIESERPKFEAWATGRLRRYPGVPKVGTTNGEYVKIVVQSMFEAWLAAKADARTVTEEMTDAGALALMKDRYSIIQIDHHRVAGTVGWQRAKVEARAVLTAALSGEG